MVRVDRGREAVNPIVLQPIAHQSRALCGQALALPSKPQLPTRFPQPADRSAERRSLVHSRSALRVHERSSSATPAIHRAIPRLPGEHTCDARAAGVRPTDPRAFTDLDARPDCRYRSGMSSALASSLVAVALVWEVLLLIPMVPGKLIDTRDFSSLPRWQFNAFNVYLTTLGLASFVVAGWLILAPGPGVLIASVVLGLGYALVFLGDLLEVFPVVADQMPTQLLVLEAIALASAGALIVLSLLGLRP